MGAGGAMGGRGMGLGRDMFGYQWREKYVGEEDCAAREQRRMQMKQVESQVLAYVVWPEAGFCAWRGVSG